MPTMTCKLHQWMQQDGEWVCVECGQPFEQPGPVAYTRRREPTLGKRQRAVLDVLRDGHWHEGPELTHPAVGGSEGLRRLRELRAKGYDIEMRRTAKDRTTREYRLKPRGEE